VKIFLELSCRVVSSVFILQKFSYFLDLKNNCKGTCKGFEGHAATTKVPCDRHGSTNLENQLQEIPLIKGFPTLPKAPSNFLKIFCFSVCQFFL
jgi:hypothetical protein